MKKITAILLLSLFLFNWIGYGLLSSFLEVKADMQLQTQLDDNNYDDSQLVSMKVPVTHLSYYNNSPMYEIADGKIEIGKVLYHYVKRRIYNDSLEVLCIPNQEAMRLRAAKNNFFASVNGLQQASADQGKKQSANADILKNLLLEYYPTENMPLTGVFCFISFRRYADHASLLSSIYILTPGQPPERAVITA
ncbi:MAG TPA: hypothetical protein VHD83_21525 [Puia sp.]|nr:hypothetical protein [Puia sp.]